MLVPLNERAIYAKKSNRWHLGLDVYLMLFIYTTEVLVIRPIIFQFVTYFFIH